MTKINQDGQLYWDFENFTVKQLKEILDDLQDNPIENPDVHVMFQKQREHEFITNDGGYVRVYFDNEEFNIELGYKYSSATIEIKSVREVIKYIFDYFLSREFEQGDDNNE